MVKPRAARKKPIVLSSDTDGDGASSPPPKRPKRGTLLTLSNGARGDARSSTAQTRHVSSTKPPSPSAKKSPAKSPGKLKPVYRPITSFFGTAPPSQSKRPSPSPDKSVVSTPLEEFDEIFDSSDDDRPTQRPTALPVQKGKALPTIHSDSAPKGSSRFIRAANGARNTPPSSSQSARVVVDAADRRPWSEKYGPELLDELAVHKKKVADVRTWLSGVFAGKERKRLLLLKGPAGSGKTTTVSLLSKEMGFHINEWKNPIGSMATSEGLVSATAQFEDFVSRTGAFGTLAFDGATQAHQQPTPNASDDREKQLILVEEFPNTFTRTSSALQSFRSAILHFLAANTPSATTFFSGNAQHQSVTPIVMIVSETLLSTNTAAADSFTAHRLLGPDILTHSGVSVIEFNPIAPTFMTKALDLMVLKEARKSGRKNTVGPQVIQRLSELGDIRSAVSSLEFLCLRGDETEGWGAKVNFGKKKGPKDISLTKMEQESLEMITQRESTLGIFHAVGRVVYNKRLSEDANSPVPQPPNWLPDRRRPKASEVNVDALIDELGTDTQTFIAALHENYVLSCSAGDSEDTIDCINGCIDALSDADLLSPDRFGISGFGRRNFQGTSTDNLRQDEMCFQTSVRGLLFSLPHPVKRIAPPPGVMGMKAKGPGAASGAAKGSAFVMYYPASLRIWRQQEEIGGLLEMWISRAQRGELLSSMPGALKPASTVIGGVDTWRKSTQLSQPSKPAATQPDAGSPKIQDDTPPPALLGSGGSARSEMLLERLPYIPAILRKASSLPTASATTTASAMREIRKITSFTESSIAGSAGVADDEQDEHEELGEQEQWATDKPGTETPRKKKRVKIEVKREEMESAIPGGAGKGGGKMVLSDDDIED